MGETQDSPAGSTGPWFGRFAIGVGLGALGTITVSLLAITGLALLVLVPIVLIAGSAARILRPSRVAEAAGILVGGGGVLLFGALRMAASCPGSTGSCGQPNVTPLVGLSIVMVSVGVLSIGMMVLRSRRGV